ncbi:metallophosphoesterase [Paenibacillus sp. H1-7]|uniref:metallophosphoesterase family protein n=1 Tax=Paenibacillus sp. H1-7 TaxID=2282849 RepID=UPI001EF94194|nr:metallophosphoesterase [Paenibacillus sp. H1-7]ULL15862.1 metallophosphoesterase [Paenibacillus sp. H1-7]
MKSWTLSIALSLSMLLHGQPLTAAQPAAKPLLSFHVLSDIHFQAWDKRSQVKLQAALNDLNTMSPDADALIFNGDLTNGRQSDYDKLNELLKRTVHPEAVYSTIGNHEFYQAWYDAKGSWNEAGFPNGETEQASIGRFLQFTKESSIYYEKEIGGYPFLFLGSEQYRQSDAGNSEDAYLSDSQLEWLKQSLKKHGASRKPIFVFLHQPLPDTVAGSSCCVNNRAVIQHQQLKNILSAYPQVIFFTGHTHWELKHPDTLVQDRFVMLNSSSVEQPWTVGEDGGERMLSPEASEGLHVEVYDGKVIIQGRDFHSQRWIPEAQYIIRMNTK